MRKHIVLGLASFVLILMSFDARAEETKPVQLAIFEPMQLVPKEDSVAGPRLSVFYTVNKNVSGFDLVWLGVNKTTGDMKGVEIGLGNWVEGAAGGIQIGLVNHAGHRFKGLQYGFANVVEGDTSGIQWGLVNWSEGYMHGLQAGLLNVSKGASKGFDLGVVNYNEGSFEGVQLGFINYSKSLNGLQIGLANYNGNKKPMEFMVLVNWSF